MDFGLVAGLRAYPHGLPKLMMLVIHGFMGPMLPPKPPPGTAAGASSSAESTAAACQSRPCRQARDATWPDCRHCFALKSQRVPRDRQRLAFEERSHRRPTRGE